MYYEKSSAKWILQSLHMPQKYIQTLERLPEELPIGTHNWQITLEDAMCGLKANESMELTISQCYPNMYTCNNGDCIELRYITTLRFKLYKIDVNFYNFNNFRYLLKSRDFLTLSKSFHNLHSRFPFIDSWYENEIWWESI